MTEQTEDSHKKQKTDMEAPATTTDHKISVCHKKNKISITLENFEGFEDGVTKEMDALGPSISTLEEFATFRAIYSEKASLVQQKWDEDYKSLAAERMRFQTALSGMELKLDSMNVKNTGLLQLNTENFNDTTELDKKLTQEMAARKKSESKNLELIEMIKGYAISYGKVMDENATLKAQLVMADDVRKRIEKNHVQLNCEIERLDLENVVLAGKNYRLDRRMKELVDVKRFATKRPRDDTPLDLTGENDTNINK